MLRARTPEQSVTVQGSQAMVDGLWQGPTALTLDYVNVVRRIRLLGFNAVRLPFSLQVTVHMAGSNAGSLVWCQASQHPCHVLAQNCARHAVNHRDGCIWQVLFGADPAGSIATECPVFPDVNRNPTSEGILASVTHPSTQLPAGALNVFVTV